MKIKFGLLLYSYKTNDYYIDIYPTHTEFGIKIKYNDSRDYIDQIGIIEHGDNFSFEPINDSRMPTFVKSYVFIERSINEITNTK